MCFCVFQLKLYAELVFDKNMFKPSETNGSKVGNFFLQWRTTEIEGRGLYGDHIFMNPCLTTFMKLGGGYDYFKSSFKSWVFDKDMFFFLNDKPAFV